MAKNQENKNIKTSRKILLVLAVFGLAYAVAYYDRTDNFAQGADCNLLEGDDKKKCEELEKKAKAYQDILNINNKTQLTLESQLASIEAEQEKNRAEIDKTLSKAEQLSQEIDFLKKQIAGEERQIAFQKKILSGLMQAYYADYQQGLLNIVLADESSADILVNTDRLEHSSLKVSDVLSSIQESHARLVAQKDELEEKKLEHERAKKELEDKNQSLRYTEVQKQTLLSKTQGEERKYQELLSKIERQKMQLFNFSEASNLAEINASVSSYPKPPSKYWATSWYFNQTDPRWGSKTIGNSKSTMADWGCAVTSVSMVFTKHGAGGIDPGKLAKQPIFFYDLIQWPSGWDPGIVLSSGIGHTGVNWNTVKSEVSKGNPVIVYIKKTNGKGGHYVVIHNYDDSKKDYVVNDPYFGANLYLGTSKALVGKIGVNSGVVLDQMIIYKKK